MMKKCRFCGEKIKEGLLLCPFCLRDQLNKITFDSDNGEELIKVFSVSSENIGHIVKGLLEEKGITCVLKSYQISQFDSVGVYIYGSWGEIQVKKKDAEKVVKIIQKQKPV